MSDKINNTDKNTNHSLSFDDGSSLFKRKFLELIPPVILANLSSLILVYVDGIFAGNLVNEEAFVGISLFQPMVNFIGAVCGFVTGFPLIMSKVIGENDEAKQKTCLKASLVTLALVIVAIILIEIPATHILLKSCGNQQYLKAYAIPYYITNVVGAISYWGIYCFIAYGKTKSIFILSLTESLSNVVFDFVFVYLLKMGVVGAAIGTLLANLLRAVLTLILIKNIIGFREIFSYQVPFSELWLNVRDIITHSIPNCISSLTVSIQVYAMNLRYMALFGNEGIVVSTVNDIVLNCAFFTFSAVITAASPILGVLKGAKENERTRQCMNILFRMNIVIGIFFFIVLTAGNRLFYMLCGIENLPEIAFPAALLAAIALIPRGLTTLTKLFLTFEKKTVLVSVLVLFQLTILPIVFAYTLCEIIPIFIFAVFGISDCIALSIYWFYYRNAMKEQLSKDTGSVRLSLTANKENASSVSEYVYAYLKSQGISNKTAYALSLCTEEMLAYLPNEKNKKDEVLLLIYPENQDIVFHMITDMENLHLDTLKQIPAYKVVFDNYELVYRLASGFEHQYVINMNHITIRFKNES